MGAMATFTSEAVIARTEWRLAMECRSLDRRALRPYTPSVPEENMTRQTTAVLALALSLAVIRPALAQVASEGGGAEKCMGGPAGSKCGGAGAAAGEHDLRVKFDKEDAKGEIMCKKGKLKDGKVVFAKCAHDKLDKYDKIAIRKKIISKEKFDALPAKKKAMVKKLAFYDSASKKLRDDLKEMGEDKRDDIEYKKLKGAQEKVDKEFDKSLAACAKEDAADFTCPSKD